MFENALLTLYKTLPEWSRLKHNQNFEAKIDHILRLKLKEEQHNLIKLRWEREKLQKMLNDLRSADSQN